MVWNFRNSVAVVLLILAVVRCATEPDTVEATGYQFPEEYEQFDPCMGTEFNTARFQYNSLPRDFWPFRSPDYRKPYADSIRDAGGIPLFEYPKGSGQKRYHPLFIAEEALYISLSNYYLNEDTAELLVAKRSADHLISTATQLDSSLLFAYSFDFNLHGDEREVMQAPWVSAMAQGEILTLLVRLYELTEEERYLDAAQKTYNSFYRFKGDGNELWVSCIDSSGNLWLEEYPMDYPNFTLNGKMFALFGIYEYFRVTRDTSALTLMDGALLTLKERIPDYMRDGDVSVYCLRHEYPLKKYHRVHIEELWTLYHITGDEAFADYGQQLYEDHTSGLSIEIPFKKQPLHQFERE